MRWQRRSSSTVLGHPGRPHTNTPVAAEQVTTVAVVALKAGAPSARANGRGVLLKVFGRSKLGGKHKRDAIADSLARNPTVSLSEELVVSRQSHAAWSEIPS